MQLHLKNKKYYYPPADVIKFCLAKISQRQIIPIYDIISINTPQCVKSGRSLIQAWKKDPPLAHNRERWKSKRGTSHL